ncbi:hypothetical protein BC349_06200 [Flavihumibacter stibioxidans]|uniref:Uncharacterized protein n=1 Tax=Flavihumibacter stibioxidans TaxID=1834163 RepID=A0ABR7M6B2_9BACT|nr:hypothetical protein [Flavihumibacter stibioxidans]
MNIPAICILYFPVLKIPAVAGGLKYIQYHAAQRGAGQDFRFGLALFGRNSLLRSLLGFAFHNKFQIQASSFH